MLTKTKETTAELVDRLGTIKAELAALSTDEKEIVEKLKAKGVAVYSGEFFDANVFESSSSKLNKEALCKKHKLMSKWIAACTTTTETTVCKVTARVQR
jgi:hypothetical protein